MFHRLVSSLLLFAGLAVAETVAPLAIRTCSDDDPNVVECRRQALQHAVPLLAAGIPHIGAAPIDPMDHLPPLTWSTNARGLEVNFRLENIRWTGLGRSIVDNLHVDTINKRINVITHIDGVSTLEGTYNMAGRILGVPMEGNGLFKVILNGGAVDVTYSGHLENGERGQSYLKLDSVHVALTLVQPQYELTGLFGDFQPLVHAGNNFINSVAAKIVEPNIVPTVEKWLSDVFHRYAQAVFSTVPYDQLFPKTPAYSGFYRAVFPHHF